YWNWADLLVTKPMDADVAARAVPAFITSCSQFMVEYAGDFLEQDNDPNSPTYGQVTNAYFPLDFATPTAPATDGVTDFIVQWNDANGNGLIDVNERDSVRRSIR